jgi:hypothetical protein
MTFSPFYCGLESGQFIAVTIRFKEKSAPQREPFPGAHLLERDAVVQHQALGSCTGLYKRWWPFCIGEDHALHSAWRIDGDGLSG